MSAPWSRRALLATLACMSAGALTGCEEQTSEDIQVGPTDAQGRRPAPAQAADVTLLRAELHRARDLVALGARLGPGPQSGLLGEVQSAHGRQADVLARLLQAAGVDPGPATPPPEPGTGATPTPVPGSTSSPPGDAGQGATATAAPPAPRRERVARLVASLPDDVAPQRLRPLAEASAANLPMLVSLHGERAAAALLLGAPLTWPELAGPAGARTVGLLAALRPAVYSLEVTSARASGAERERYEMALVPVRQLTRQVTELAGPAAPAAPLGYGLPEPLSTAKQRTALVIRALQPLPAAVVEGSAGLTGDLAAISGSVRLLAEVIRVGHPFGLPVTGFPGMSVP